MSNFANLCICILCAVWRYFLSPLEHFLLKTLHMLRWSRPYRAKTGNSPEYTSPSRHWSRARLKTKANKTIPSSQVVYNRSFFVMDANLQPLRHFVIKSIFSASRPTTPILCFCTTKEEASHGGWKTCNDPTHQQHSMVWGSENIISLKQQKFKLQHLKMTMMSTFKRSAPEWWQTFSVNSFNFEVAVMLEATTLLSIFQYQYLFQYICQAWGKI